MNAENAAPSIDAVRVQDYLRAQFNSVAGLTPPRLAGALDAFKRGYLRELALMMEAIEERDDVLAAVVPKRKKAPARHGWEIIQLDGSPEARAHKEFLADFYNHLTATSALDQDQQGGLQLLFQQMMDAVGKRYSVHEIVWEPRADGRLSATFWHAPLAFFERTTGRMRFLRAEGMIDGEEMEPQNWLVCVGQGVMLACAVAYLFKTIPLKDWLVYSARHGMPGIEGVCDAAPGSPEWSKMRDVVAMAGREMAWVRNSAQQVNRVDFGAEGDLPYPPLVDRMDRALSRIWRGADLSTLSAGAGSGQGASIQGAEGEILERDDAEWLGESLKRVSRAALEWKFGAGVRPMAYLKVLARPLPPQTALDLQIDDFLLRHGVDLSVPFAREKYGRPAPADGDELMRARPPGEPAGRAGSAANSPGDPADRDPGADPADLGRAGAANEAAHETAASESATDAALRACALRQRAAALATALAPLRERMSALAAIDDPAERDAALRAARAELPALLQATNAQPAAAPVIAQASAAAFWNAVIAGQAAARRTPQPFPAPSAR